MRKIIAAFDGLKYSESTTAYAIELAKKYNALLVGAFLEDRKYHSYSVTDLIDEDDPDEAAAYLGRRDADLRENAISMFSKACETDWLRYSIHRNKNIAIRELLKETRYADVLVIQNNETLSQVLQSPPSNFITALLERTECPVVLVPPLYRKIEKTIFLYDGTPSSVFAIKQFAYLMPGPDINMQVDLLSVKPKGEDTSLPEGHNVKEWLKLYYPGLQYTIANGNPAEEIMKFLNEQVHNCLVVMGAYNRSGLSRLINPSMADTIMKSLNFPLFISHK
ncbi:MAG: universal stress protein [Chitinophagaceae bacterium]|nr:universal stress protein [Chitinophagaceae bacterium]